MLIWDSLAKEQLVGVIKAYKSRTYDEDLDAIMELGGKFHLRFTYQIGVDEIARKLDVDIKLGLKDQNVADNRESYFGTNRKDLMKPWSCC